MVSTPPTIIADQNQPDRMAMRVSRQRQSAQAIPRITKKRTRRVGYRLTGECIHGASITAIGEDREGGGKLVPQNAGPKTIRSDLDTERVGWNKPAEEGENVGATGKRRPM